MRAGELTEKVQILRPVYAERGSGAKRVARWDDCGTWSAQLRSSRAYRRDEVGEHFADHSATFLTRISVPAGENWRLRHIGGVLYTITAVEASRRLDMKTLTCERVNE